MLVDVCLCVQYLQGDRRAKRANERAFTTTTTSSDTTTLPSAERMSISHCARSTAKVWVVVTLEGLRNPNGGWKVVVGWRGVGCFCI